jgi:membrane protein YdbS with pleckstrin-like domain
MTEKDKAFMQYWEQQRDAQSTFASKLLRGLPMAILFALPVILSVIAVWIFLPDWYAKISKNSSGAFATVVVAMLVIVVFYAWFRMHYKWEINEQIYQELKAKQQKEKSPGLPEQQ